MAVKTLNSPGRRYKAFGAALDLWKRRDPELVIAGPAGTGKSRACLEKIHAACLRWPGMRALIVRKTRESLTESALVTFEEKVLPEGDPLATGVQRRLRQAYHYPNGSEVVVGGLDKPSKVMSTEYDIIYVQEAIELSEHDWESLTTRLRNGVMPYQQILADTNPDSPLHWLRLRADRGGCVMLESRHEDNPVLWDARAGEWTETGRVYIAKLDALSGARKPRLRFGKWVQAEGVVYETWDRNVHLIDRRPIEPHWRKIRAIDFGYQNPFVCLWLAVDPDGCLIIYREIYMSGRTVARHAEQIKALSGTERYEVTVADHDREDRATLEEAGIWTVPAYKDIQRGIQAVETRLAKGGNGKPRLALMRDSLVEADPSMIDGRGPWCTEQEFDAYVWPKGQDGKPIKEIPVDKDNHGMDAMRYAVAYVDQLSGRVSSSPRVGPPQPTPPTVFIPGGNGFGNGSARPGMPLGGAMNAPQRANGPRRIKMD